MSAGQQDDDTSIKRNADQKRDEKRVDRTLLDINLDDLIDPLSEGLTTTSQDEPPLAKDLAATKAQSRVAKTLLETELPSLSEVKDKQTQSAAYPKSDEIATSTNSTESASNLKDATSALPESVPAVSSISRVAKTQIELSIPVLTSEPLMDGEKPIPSPKMQKVFSKQNLKRLKTRKISNTMLDLDLPIPAMDKLCDLSGGNVPPTNAEALSSAASGGFGQTNPIRSSSSGKSEQLNLDTLSQAAGADLAGTSGLPTVKNAAVHEQAAQEAGPLSSSGTTDSDRQKKIVRRREQFVPKTMLDHNMLFTALSNSSLREEAKVAALVEARANEPHKPKPVPVKADRPASTCPFKWDETDSKEKYRYCSNCQTPIYNFEGMERADAEALIFNRENRKKFVLFGRADGKFMTTDCPLQAKRKSEMMFAFVGATALFIGAVTIITFMPKDSAQTSAQAPTAVSTSSPSVKAANNSANNATRLQTFQFPEAKSGQSNATDTPYSDPDEDGRFWKFDGGR